MTILFITYIIGLGFALLGSLSMRMTSGNIVRDALMWGLLVLAPITNLPMALIGVSSLLIWITAAISLIDILCHELGVLGLRAIMAILPHKGDTNA